MNAYDEVSWHSGPMIKLTSIDKDATLAVDFLCSLPNCTGRIAATGMCLGGHLVRQPINRYPFRAHTENPTP